MESGSEYPASHVLRGKSGRARDKGHILDASELASAANAAFERECEQAHSAAQAKKHLGEMDSDRER